MGWATTYIAELKAGRQVAFRPTGNSMTPRIKPKELCTVVPLVETDTLEKGDVVLCSVNGSQFLHIVTAVQGDHVQISNNHNYVNGWTGRAQVYGKLVSVTP